METIEKISKAINELRLVPRVMAILWTYITFTSWEWFTMQDDISTGQGAFLAAITASASAFCKFYVQSGPRSKE